MLRTDFSGARATFTIDDVDRRNPLTDDVLSGLIEGIRKLDRATKVIVITGAGDKAFCAGGDLSGGFFDQPLETHRDRSKLGELFATMRRCDQPIVARVNGHALAGGFGLMLACDIAVAADHATFGTPEVNVGLFPMMITTVIQRSLAPKVAFELVMSGRRIDASEALSIGAVSKVVPAGDLDGAIDELVDGLTNKSAAVLAMGKHAFYAVQDLSFDTALEHLAAGLTAVAMTDDAREGMEAFVGKRTPDFKGR